MGVFILEKQLANILDRVSCFSVTLFCSTLLALTHGQNDRQRNKLILVGLATVTGFSRLILVGLATLTGPSRLILVGLGNLRFLQVNPGWAGHPDGFLQVNPGWAGHPDRFLQVNPGWADHPDGFLQVNPGWAG